MIKIYIQKMTPDKMEEYNPLALQYELEVIEILAMQLICKPFD